MLSNEMEEKLAERLALRINEVNDYILLKIGQNIKEISTIKPSDAYKLQQILKYGGSYEEITRKLSTISGKNVEEIFAIFTIVAKENKEFAKKFFKYRNIKMIPYEEDIALKNQVDSIAKLTANTYRNISNTRGIGFLMEDLDGQVHFKNLQDSYNEVIDRGILSISQGKETFQEEMTRIIKQIGNSGLVLYDTGNTRRLDSAVRMNLLDGIRQLNVENSLAFGKLYNADGVEISVHTNPAPDHADIQGRQFSNEEYEKLEMGEIAQDIKGNIYDGSEKRQIAHYNCYHKVFAIVIGASEPEYTDEQLEQIQETNEKGFEFEGKHYTMYEGTQLQRKIETAIRKQKDIQILARTSGEDFAEVAMKSQQKINLLVDKYKKLSNASGLREQRKRMSVSQYRKIKVEK